MSDKLKMKTTWANIVVPEEKRKVGTCMGQVAQRLADGEAAISAGRKKG